MNIHRKQALRARDLRRTSTPAEQALWRYLRARRLGGLKFRRQYPIGPFFADFYCAEASLVVEADGPIHRERAVYDARRDTFLGVAGFRVLHFTNEEILERPRGVLRRILREALRSLHAEPKNNTAEGDDGGIVS